MWSACERGKDRREVDGKEANSKKEETERAGGSQNVRNVCARVDAIRGG